MLLLINDLTAKDREWKGLDKLKDHLDKDKDKTETNKEVITEEETIPE